MIRVHILVYGRVHGVLFRDGTRRKANSLNIFGWVMNLPKRRVEIIAEGEKESIQKLIDWTKKGTFLSRVEKVEVKEQLFKNEL